MVFLWAAAALTGCTPDTDSELSDGKPAPDIRGVDAEGQSFRLSDYRGKVVLLDFWASY
jgi:peroxiredoxin